ncbi:hypothetical protein INS49_004176 [Diaporthe citri]|uniref:uncharacterized protein n=1 Tax=Diaporthe citri TaxID=83186 RepID=UPI001C8268BA|nr:uncharacterized protein INS49_004176 [Diaporthe citri]KAG6355095.1 hypothetical protein INS49_004176 [Diaporthe citri]
MDFGGCSDAKMSAQIHNTMSSDLDKCVKVAEMSSIKLVNAASQPDPTPYYKRIKTRDQIDKEGFPKFGKLPAELRLKVWENAMPPYGLFTVLMLGREEPKPQQPPPPAPLAFRVVYRLEPVARDQQDDELRMRLDTMRAIQRTNSEAASEVQRAFPTTINCTGGKLRFNAEEETLSLSNAQCILSQNFLLRFERYNEGAMAFADDWHKIPRKMTFIGAWWNPFAMVNYWLQAPKATGVWGNPPRARAMEGFMGFLADCTRLTTLGFTYNQVCDERVMLMPPPQLSTLHHEVLPSCHLVPDLKRSFYDDIDGWPKITLQSLQYLVASVRGLEALIYGLGTGQELPIHWPGMRFGRPELQHLQVQAMIPAKLTLLDLVERTVKAQEL